jgi:hypothetical protein
MKKISVSLIAILAIVVAVSSAFTTKSKFVTDRWERFGVNQNTVTGSSSATVIDGQKRSDLFNLVKVTPMTDVTAEKNSFNFSSPKDISCAVDNTFICTAILSYDQNTPTVKTIVDYDLGDYSIQP